jgi:hypothetical protein
MVQVYYRDLGSPIFECYDRKSFLLKASIEKYLERAYIGQRLDEITDFDDELTKFYYMSSLIGKGELQPIIEWAYKKSMIDSRATPLLFYLVGVVLGNSKGVADLENSILLAKKVLEPFLTNYQSGKIVIIAVMKRNNVTCNDFWMFSSIQL